MKLTFDFFLKDLSGKPMQGNPHCGQVVADHLSASNEQNSVKIYDWCLSIYQKKGIEVDATDFGVLRALIDNSKTLAVLTKGQALSHMDDVKEKADKIKK